MPNHVSKSLNSCMDWYFDESQPSPHIALEDAKCVKALCENYADDMDYDSFDEFLDDHGEYLHNF